MCVHIFVYTYICVYTCIYVYLSSKPISNWKILSQYYFYPSFDMIPTAVLDVPRTVTCLREPCCAYWNGCTCCWRRACRNWWRASRVTRHWNSPTESVPCYRSLCVTAPTLRFCSSPDRMNQVSLKTSLLEAIWKLQFTMLHKISLSFKAPSSVVI